MDNLARQEQAHLVYQEIGTVVNTENETFFVNVGDSHYLAKKAASCLLIPESRDTVLVATSAAGQCYILSVLERFSDDTSRLHFDGDVELMSRSGKLRLGSLQGIDMTSPEQIKLTSSSLQIMAEQGECRISRFAFLGDLFDGKITGIKLISKTVESLCDLIRVKSKRSYRTVEDTEQLKAGKIEYNAEKLMSLRGKYSVITAKEDMKIDGKMIHMG